MSTKLFENNISHGTKVFDGPGRGKKQCGSCGKYVGVRTKVCACGSIFAKKKNPDGVSGKTKKKSVKSKQGGFKKPDGENILNEKYCLILTPAGKCPIKLSSTDYESVISWSGEVRNFGFSKREYYSVSALKYFARQFFDIFSDDYLTVEGHLETIPRLDSEPDTSKFYQERLKKKNSALSRLLKYDLKVIDVVDQDDGTAIVNVDITHDFMNDYMEAYSLREWSHEHFQKWFLESIERGIELEKKLQDNS